MAKSLDELCGECVPTPDDEENEEQFDGDDEPSFAGAMGLLHESMTLFGFLADVSLVPNITTRDRDVMLGTAERIKAFLDEVDGEEN